MSDEKQETIEDIVSEMREYESTPPPRDAWLDLADSIEAAWKAERERAKADALVVGGMVEVMRREKRGNAAKIREAYEFAEEFLRDYGTDWKLHNKLCDMLKSALAAPLRNCDIYDAESCRMAYHLHGDGLMTMQAFADWLFAPVEEGETKGE